MKLLSQKTLHKRASPCFPCFRVLSCVRARGDFWSMEIIRVKDMLNTMIMRGADGELIPFSITFVTCDEKQDRGGKKITLDRAVLLGGPSSRNKRGGRDPRHFANYTRNIRHVDSDRIIKIHALLVTRFNGMRVAQ